MKRAWALEGISPPRNPLGEIPDGATPGEAWEREAIARAHAQAVARTMRPILDAVEDGDVKTAKWLLERQSPEDFAAGTRRGEAPAQAAGSAGLTLNIFADAARQGTLSRQDLMAAAWGAPAVLDYPEPTEAPAIAQEAQPEAAASRPVFKRRTPRRED